MRLSIIIPLHNEATTLREVLRRVGENIPSSVTEHEIIVVDDGSTDGSGRIAEEVAGIRLFRLPERRGKGAALKEGLAHAKGHVLLIQDADLEYFPEDYSALLAPLANDPHRVVFGSRSLRRNERNRFFAFGNAIITQLFNMRFGTRLTDIATCYKVFPRELIPALLERPENDFVFDVLELSLAVVQKGRSITEVPVRYAPRGRRAGKKLRLRHGLRILFALLRAPSPHHA